MLLRLVVCKMRASSLGCARLQFGLHSLSCRLGSYLPYVILMLLLRRDVLIVSHYRAREPNCAKNLPFSALPAVTKIPLAKASNLAKPKVKESGNILDLSIIRIWMLLQRSEELGPKKQLTVGEKPLIYILRVDYKFIKWT